MTISTIADLRAALIAGVEAPGAADHAAIVKGMLAFSGLDETGLARALKVSVPTVERYAQGASAPYASMRPAMYGQFLGILMQRDDPAPAAEPVAVAHVFVVEATRDGDRSETVGVYSTIAGARLRVRVQVIAAAVARDVALTPDQRAAVTREILETDGFRGVGRRRTVVDAPLLDPLREVLGWTDYDITRHELDDGQGAVADSD